MIMLAVHEILAITLLYTCFCRAVKTDRETRRPVLLAFWLLSIAATVAVFAPLALHWKPDAVSMLLLLSIVVVQLVTSSYWRHGIPQSFKEH